MVRILKSILESLLGSRDEKTLKTTLVSTRHLGDCQNYGPFLGPYYNTGPNTGPNLGDPKRDHNFDNPPSETPPGHPRAPTLNPKPLSLSLGPTGIVFLKEIEYGFGYIIIRSPCTPYSIFLRGVIVINPKPRSP